MPAIKYDLLRKGYILTVYELRNLTFFRELKGKLMDAERFKELVTKAQQRISSHLSAIAKMKQEIKDTKDATQRCRIDVMNAKNRKPPTYNKDTHVNLDMQMWVTHNQTREEYDQEVENKYKVRSPINEKDKGYREYKDRQMQMQAAQHNNYYMNYGEGRKLPVHVATFEGKQQQQHAGPQRPPMMPPQPHPNHPPPNMQQQQQHQQRPPPAPRPHPPPAPQQQQQQNKNATTTPTRPSGPDSPSAEKESLPAASAADAWSVAAVFCAVGRNVETGT